MEHDHSAHAATTPAVPGAIAHPVHGTWPGHVLPGSFFLIWSAWWLFSVFRCQLQPTARAVLAVLLSAAYTRHVQAAAEGQRKGGLHQPQLVRVPVAPALARAVGAPAQAGAAVPGRQRRDLGGPHVLQVLPVQLRCATPLHVRSRKTWCRNLYAPDGRFEMGNMQDWQHATMYMAFCASGLVDLIGFYLPGVLPGGTEHVRLTAACDLSASCLQTQSNPPSHRASWGLRFWWRACCLPST